VKEEKGGGPQNIARDKRSPKGERGGGKKREKNTGAGPEGGGQERLKEGRRKGKGKVTTNSTGDKNQTQAETRLGQTTENRKAGYNKWNKKTNAWGQTKGGRGEISKI